MYSVQDCFHKSTNQLIIKDLILHCQHQGMAWYFEGDA